MKDKDKEKEEGEREAQDREEEHNLTYLTGYIITYLTGIGILGIMVQESVGHVGPSGHFKIKIVHSARVGWGATFFPILIFILFDPTPICSSEDILTI